LKTIVPENPWLQETGNPFVTIISPNGWSTKPAALISLLNGYRRRWEFGGRIFCTISSVGSSTRRYNWSIVIVEVKWSTSTRSAASSVVSVKRVHCIGLTTVVCTSVIQKQVEITVCDEGITRQSSRHEARYMRTSGTRQDDPSIMHDGRRRQPTPVSKNIDEKYNVRLTWCLRYWVRCSQVGDPGEMRKRNDIRHD